MDAGKPTGRDFSSHCIELPPPTRSSNGDTSCGEPIDGGEREALGLAVVPAEASENADILRKLLLYIESETILQRSWLAYGCYIRPLTGLLAYTNGIAISTRASAILRTKNSDRTGMTGGFVTAFPLKHVGAISKQAPIEAQTVSYPRLSGAGVPEGPISRVEFVNPAPGVTAGIGWIIPGAVVHDGPTHELSPRIVRVAVIVKEIGYGETANGNAVTDHGALTTELIGIALDFLFRISEAEILRDVEPGDVWFGRSATDSRQFSVGKVRDAVHPAEAAPPRNLRVEIEQGVGGQPETEEEGCGERDIALRDGLQAELSLVWRVELAVVITDGSGLIKKVPPLTGRVVRGTHRVRRSLRRGQEHEMEQ
jgi:hypothetical protein